MRKATRPGAGEPARRFDMRALLRLATWGLSAAGALLLAALAGYPHFTSQRLVALPAWAAAGGPRDAAVRPGDREDESRRLAEIVRGLSADREALLRRIVALEQGLE